ncbi:unnamed protein product [Nippostrongylus brasiliensis]|uniref:Myosin_tail_1 domain-containing protein n=1 Tax=Nippostrongylus brasiliensis TaxID=27835 RepID=A0A158R2E6_NIPBR|nr:unnamed protein product [Nippostrongylus brasiliensis]
MEKMRTQKQIEMVAELQRAIADLNGRLANFDSVLQDEKNMRRKKEECRRKDQEISRLEKKLEDKEVVMADCVKDLKDQQRTRVMELEEKIADMKRKLLKLESENNVQKMKLETSFEKESSVDSDYGRSSSGRMSNSARQYSLMSFSSFSSVRTLNRRMADSDMSSSLYSSRQNHNANATLEDLRRQLCAAESAADSLSERLRRAQADGESWKRKHEEALNEAKNDILHERKRAAEKIAACQHENNLRIARRGTDDSERDRLREELNRTQAELDRAVTTIRQLESNVQSQETLGGTLEAQYRNALMELETARDENCALKAKIRRQYKQIELLTR